MNKLPEEDPDPTGDVRDRTGAGASEKTRSAVRRATPTNRPAPARRDEELPRALTAKYRIDRLVAIGGMGRVYAGTQLALDRTVAIKLLSTQRTNEDFRNRFLLEASISARLTHRNIVTVHDYGESADGGLFMVMELLPGEPLTALLARETRLSPERSCRIAIEVCRGLRAAHREGVAHRDLKPGNVMILAGEDDGESDRVKVLDFGLVKVFQESEEAPPQKDLTRGETMLGSPRYMAPEQIVCDPVDNRADIYSLGVLLFTMVTGGLPFDGKSTVQILQQHLHAPVPRLDASVVLREGEASAPPVGAMLDDIVQRCMQKKPADRYQTIDEVMQALSAAYSTLAGGRTSGELAAFSRGDNGEASGTRPQALAPSLTPTPAPMASFGLQASPPSRARTGSIIAVILGIVALVAVIVMLGAPPEEDVPPTAATTTPREPEARPEPPQPAPEPVVAAPRSTLVSLTSAPAGAEVRLDGRVLGVTPMEHSMESPEGGARVVFELTLAGHRVASVPALVRGESVSVHAELQPEPSAPVLVVPTAVPSSRRRAHASEAATETSGASAEPAPAGARQPAVDEVRRGVPIVD